MNIESRWAPETVAAVKAFVAKWLQLGKHLELPGRSAPAILRETVQGDRYTPAFEALWVSIVRVELGNAYLSGTDVTIADLLTGRWELQACGRCGLPVPLPPLGQAYSGPCVCADLTDWPNAETVPPHQPVQSEPYFQDIRNRLDRDSQPSPCAS
ncbi:MAG: hypothetical protein HC918_07880 [Oscillatoriales cyanobacterium SM2_1_8]|nr:hypothetical protein [Oscillatoriales cyanobacterium SM2_1_8]